MNRWMVIWIAMVWISLTSKLKNKKKSLKKYYFDQKIAIFFFFFRMLTFDPAKRISAKQCLQHPYFDDLDKMELPAKPGEFEIPVPS